MSIDAPNYTQVPNDLFLLMPDMDKSELKVVLAVCRQTIGWHKTKDRLTITRLMTLTGLSRQSVYDGISKAIDRGILIQDECPEDGYVYSLDIRVSNEETPSVQPLDTQKKEKESKETAAAIVEKQPTQDTPNIFKLYENLGLALNPTIAEQLTEAEKEYPPDWIVEAFKRAAAANVRRWNYIEGILKRWQAAGGMDYPERAEQLIRPSENAPIVNMQAVVLQ